MRGWGHYEALTLERLRSSVPGCSRCPLSTSFDDFHHFRKFWRKWQSDKVIWKGSTQSKVQKFITISSYKDPTCLWKSYGLPCIFFSAPPSKMALLFVMICLWKRMMADGAGFIMKIKNRRFEVLKCLGRIKRNDTKVAEFFNEQKFGSLKASIQFQSRKLYHL